MNKLLIIISMFLGTTAIDQKNDFSGTWTLIDQLNISGKLYANGVPKHIKILQKSDSITFDKTISGQNNEDVKIIETIGINGKPFEVITPTKRKKVSSLKLDDDKKSFLSITNIYNSTDAEKPDYIITDKWSMEGADLILQRKNENLTNGEIWESKSFYKRKE